MTRLLVDAMCGDLLAYLRMCGHDAVYAPDAGLEADDELLASAETADRVLVTRDRQLAARADSSVLLASQDTETQLASLLDAGVDLELTETPGRCGRCNGTLRRVDADAVTPEYAPAPDERPVWECADCGQCFWRGSHWDRVGETVARIGDDDASATDAVDR